MINNKIKLIAELGCNHQGIFSNAIKMIDSLVTLANDVDIIKFQKRTPKLILSETEYNTPHPDSKNAFAETYGLHREFLEFNIEQHKQLKEYCEKKNFTYSSSVFDIQSTKEILSLNPQVIKISSANNNDYNLLEYIDDNYNGEIHISLGMTTRNEEENIVSRIKNNRQNLVLFACTSAYPTPANKNCLLEISRLKETYGHTIKAIGFSGHHLDTIQDVVAVTLGATYIERHYTLDKTLKGTDQKISLDISNFESLIKNIKIATQALTFKETEILDMEMDIRNRLKFKGELCQK